MIQAHSFQRYLNVITSSLYLFLSFSPVLNFNLNVLVCSPFSKLWQLLFMERSALLLDPSTSESESDQSHLQAAAVEEEEEGPSEVPVASVGGTDPLVPEPERPSRPPSQGRRQSHTPAVEGLVEMTNYLSLILICLQCNVITFIHSLSISYLSWFCPMPKGPGSYS